MLNKQSKLYSVLYFKCPRCHDGDLFSVKNPYKLKTMLDMPLHCPVCNQDFIIEPGFYAGALWTSYPIVIGVLVITWLILSRILNFSSGTVLISGTLICLLFQPLIMRLGRSIWINIFVTYKGK